MRDTAPRDVLRALSLVALTVLLAFAAATAVRYGLIEREDLGPACDAAGAPWWCGLRMLVIRAFLVDGFGYASIGCAVLALWRGSRGLALATIAIGTVGMVLYNFTWAGVGVVVGTIALARSLRPRQQHRETERDARAAPGH